MGIGGAAALVAGNAIMDALGLGKAYLEVFEPILKSEKGDVGEIKKGASIDEFKFDYNPKELTFSRKANVKKDAAAGAGDKPPPTQLLSPAPEEHTFELFYSKFEMPDAGGGKFMNDLTKIKNKLLDLVAAHPSTKDAVPLRPVVKFGWGSFSSKLSFVESVNVVFEMFLPNGEPLRMKATITIQEARDPAERQNPTSGGKAPRRAHTLLAGETLATVAFKEYSNPTMWRAIAEENGIDDPFRLTAGTELMLPPLDEAVELA